MLAGAEYQRHVHHVGAHRMCDELLWSHFAAQFDWIANADNNVTESKFSLDMAWFRECWWEVVRRGMVEVH